MMVTEQYRDLMNRTICNLQIVELELKERKKRGVNVDLEGPFEFTQLVNSFLGAFALPRERDLPHSLARIKLKDAKANWGVPELSDDYPECTHVIRHDGRVVSTKPTHLNALARLIRNALLHGNFEIQGNRNIERINIWNFNDYAGLRTWGTTLDVDTLRQLLFSFHEVAEHLYRESQKPQRKRVA